MIRMPRLKRFLTVFPISDSAWGLRGGTDEIWRVKLSNERAMEAFCALLPLLTGKHATEEIYERLEAKGIDRRVTVQILRYLENASLIEEADDAGLSAAELERYRDQIAFFSRFTAEGGGRQQAALGRARVGLVAGGALGRALQRQLAAAGVGEILLLAGAEAEVVEAAEPEGDGPHPRTLPLDREAIWPEGDGAPELPHLLLVPQERHDPELLEAVDALSRRRRLPWMLVRVADFQEGWVGPLFIPGETAGYLSMEARLRGNMPFYEEYVAFDHHLRRTEEPARPLGGLHAFFDLLAAAAVIEVVKYLTGIRVPHLAGRFLCVHLGQWDVETHDVLRLPHLDAESDLPAVFPWREEG